MPSLEIPLISFLYEKIEKQVAEIGILTVSLLYFNSDKWSTSFSFICHTSKTTWPCLSALKCPKCAISFPEKNTPKW